MKPALAAALVLVVLVIAPAPVAEASHETCDGTADCTASHAVCAAKHGTRFFYTCTNWGGPPPPP